MKPTWPSTKAKKQWAILEAFLRGELLSVGIALRKYRTYALSQECGRLRRLGWPIDSEIVKRDRFAIYWMPPKVCQRYRVSRETK